MNYGSRPEILWDFSSDTAKDRTLIEAAINGINAIGGVQESLVPVLSMATNQIFNTRHNR